MLLCRKTLFQGIGSRDKAMTLISIKKVVTVRSNHLLRKHFAWGDEYCVSPIEGTEGAEQSTEIPPDIGSEDKYTAV